MPPRQLYVLGHDVNVLLSKPSVAVVGSRKVSAYGKTVTSTLTAEMVKAGIVIISGLAFGVDSISHRVAVEHGGITIAVMAGGLDQIYPSSHAVLARQIIERGGALVSEYPPGVPALKHQFVARNRIVSGLADALLITEAAEKSGTLHTAEFAIEQGREVLAVPGNITSPTSAGTNNLIKMGVTPVTGIADILHVLGLENTSSRAAPQGETPEEQALLDLLFSGVQDGAELLEKCQLDVSHFNQVLTMLEIRGQIRPLGNNHWSLH